MSDMEEIGKNIVLLRKAKDWSQEDLAWESGVSAGCLSGLENGDSNATMETLYRVAKVLEVDVRVLGIFMLPDAVVLAEAYKTSLFLQVPERDYGPFPYFENIRLMRGVMGLTQKQLARSSKVSVGRLRDIEHGCANTRTGTLKNIAGAFNMTMVELFNMTTPKQELMAMVENARKRTDKEKVRKLQADSGRK